MDVYNGQIKSLTESSFVFKHFSTSSNAAAERIESMFASKEKCRLNIDFSVDVLDLMGRVIRSKTFEQHITEFCEHASQCIINKYKIEMKKSLRIIDLWEDDPIGSGGIKIVESDVLSVKEKHEISKIFSPFSDVIHPHYIFECMSKKEIKAIKKKYSSNYLFNSELKKRKNRSMSIGEDFQLAQFQEIVWLDLSFKLRNWSINKGYDSFVYANNKEGNGADTYISLLPNQITKPDQHYYFDKEKYLSIAPKALLQMIMDRSKKHILEIEENGVMWAEQIPFSFWSLD